jgi:fructose-1-phosphate kinase PfkB-like protein
VTVTSGRVVVAVGWAGAVVGVGATVVDTGDCVVAGLSARVSGAAELEAVLVSAHPTVTNAKLARAMGMRTFRSTERVYGRVRTKGPDQSGGFTK